MADRVSVSITIGGNLPADQVPKLIELANASGLTLEWEGEALSDDDIKSGEHLRMRAHDVTIGDVDEIGEFCCTNDLPFVCWTDGSAGSFNPETIIWVGEGPRHSFNATDDGKTLISEEEARELGSYEAILKHFALGSFEPPVLTIIPTNS